MIETTVQFSSWKWWMIVMIVTETVKWRSDCDDCFRETLVVKYLSLFLFLKYSKLWTCNDAERQVLWIRKFWTNYNAFTDEFQHSCAFKVSTTLYYVQVSHTCYSLVQPLMKCTRARSRNAIERDHLYVIHIWLQNHFQRFVETLFLYNQIFWPMVKNQKESLWKKFPLILFKRVKSDVCARLHGLS